MLTVIRETQRNRKGRIVCLLLTVLFVVILLCFSFTLQISKELAENSDADDFLDPDADKFLECPIDIWNGIETDRVPFGDFEVIERWKKQRVNKFRPSVLNALLFDEYIMVLIDTKNMSGRHVVCRYFDCLRREIPSQFESKIYPESVVYCPRRIGVHWMSITGNILEKPTRPIAIENSSLSTGDYTQKVDEPLVQLDK